jgi:hypothetical protein
MATSKERTIFVFNLEWVEYFEDLDAEARLKFYESIVSYAKTKEMPADLNNYERGIFKAIKNDIDRLDEKYEETKRKRSEAGRKGGLRSGEVRSETKQNEANEANASFVKQNEANEATMTMTMTKTMTMSPYNGGGIISPPAQEGNLSLNHQARDFVRFFNEKTEGTCIPQVKKITEKREIAIGRILHTMGRETMEEVIIKATSPNCILAAENRGVGIDWFTNEDNAIKVLEGNYDNTRPNQQGIGMGKQEARHLEQLRQLAGGDPERLAYLEATYTNR